MVEIYTLGGYTAVTKNMTAIKVDDEIVILDMGIYLPAFIDFQEEGGHMEDLEEDEVMRLGGIPNDKKIRPMKEKVKGIFIGHAHLDHVAAVPYMADKYNCPVYGSPFTMELLKSILRDHKKQIHNKIIPLRLNSTFRISDKIQIEYIAITHSTPQCALMAVHTPKGVIVYANDFKLDNFPTLGKKPNYERLTQIGKKGALAAIVETMYVEKVGKCPSEKVAKEMLREVVFDVNHKGKPIFLTTFASHIARVRTAIEFGLKLNRKVVILGRSMEKYIGAAKNLRIIQDHPKVKVYSYRRSVEKVLHQIKRNPGKYFIICTGSQGEPNSVLDKLVSGRLPFRLSPEDRVIFSTKTIPVKKNIEQRAALEKKLINAKVRMFTDVHVSGHAAREDMRELMAMIKPKHIIPSQGDPHMIDKFIDLCKEVGFKPKQIHKVKDGDIIKL